jgi:hypothetical protein
MTALKKVTASNLVASQAEQTAVLVAKFGKFIERVNPKDFIAPEPDAAMVAGLLSDEVSDWSQLMSIFGNKSYANKEQLASDQTAFRIMRVVERVHGSYNKEDDWAFEILTEKGETQVLSMDKNPTRDFMVLVLVAGLAKFGKSTPLCLNAIELAESDTRPAGRIFYTFAPAFVSLVEPKPVTATYNADPIEPGN